MGLTEKFEQPDCLRSEQRVGPLDEILFSDPARSARTAREPAEGRSDPPASAPENLNSANLKELTTLLRVGLRLGASLVNNRAQHGPLFRTRRPVYIAWLRTYKDR